jgi:hypothetical protein
MQRQTKFIIAGIAFLVVAGYLLYSSKFNVTSIIIPLILVAVGGYLVGSRNGDKLKNKNKQEVASFLSKKHGMGAPPVYNQSPQTKPSGVQPIPVADNSVRKDRTADKINQIPDLETQMKEMENMQ